jgi:hypothetical protein
MGCELAQGYLYGAAIAEPVYDAQKLRKAV